MREMRVANNRPTSYRIILDMIIHMLPVRHQVTGVNVVIPMFKRRYAMRPGVMFLHARSTSFNTATLWSRRSIYCHPYEPETFDKWLAALLCSPYEPETLESRLAALLCYPYEPDTFDSWLVALLCCPYEPETLTHG